VLAVNNIEVIYEHVILVLKGVSLRVPEGGIVALLGANGAGKSTTLKAISGLLRTERGDVTKGSIELTGEPIHRLAPDAVVRRGVVQVMEGRHVFEHLTVEENLLTGGYYPAQRRGPEAGPRSGVYILSPTHPAADHQGRVYFGRRAADARPSGGPSWLALD
jgi:branched-chain amino acid transport system ATP-binding protein